MPVVNRSPQKRESEKQKEDIKVKAKRKNIIEKHGLITQSRDVT